MARFFLIRHGQRLGRQAGDAGLSVHGHAQAQVTAQALKRQRLHAVFSSPLRRAQETAEHIAALHNLAFAVDERLRERANWGDLPRQSWQEFIEMWQRCNRERNYAPPVGDSSAQAGARLQDFIVTCYGLVPDESVAAVGHGGLFMDFLLNLFPMDRLASIQPSIALDPYSAAGVAGMLAHCCKV